MKILFQTPGADEILRTQLADAERHRAEHAVAREYHSAMEDMLTRRIERIKNELENA